MKKTIGILTLALLLAVNVNAQRQQKNGNRKGLNQTPEQMATLQSKKMALALDLDKKQQDAVYKLMKTNAEERSVLREEMKSKKENGAKLNGNQRFELNNNRLDKKIAHKSEMKKILSSEQYQKWEKMSALNSRNRSQKMKKNFNNQKQRGNRSQGKL